MLKCHNVPSTKCTAVESNNVTMCNSGIILEIVKIHQANTKFLKKQVRNNAVCFILFDDISLEGIPCLVLKINMRSELKI